MTDEELQKTIQNTSESIDRLSHSDKPLSKAEEKHKRLLLLEKEVLERIKAAREKGDKNQEITHSITYGLLTSFGEKHPILLHLARVTLGSRLFM